MTMPNTSDAHRLSWITMSLILSACSTMADVVDHKHEGTAMVYELTSDQAWELAKVVLRTEGADAIEEHRDQGYMLTSSGSNFYSRGAVMGAWVEPYSGNRMVVTVLTKRRVKTNLFTTLTEGTFHRRFAQGVRIVNSGSPLPTMLPDSDDRNGQQPVVRQASIPYAANSETDMPVSQSNGSCRSLESQPRMLSVDAVTN
jgi:hypothetical protein